METRTELANGCYSIKYDDGLEYYNQQDQRHREDGPAVIWYYKDGSIDCEDYFINDQYHREDGPEYIRYKKDGSIRWEVHALYGMYITNEHFNDQRFVTRLHLEKIG